MLALRQFHADGAGRALAHLNLGHNYIGAAGAMSFAGVLAQCPALAHLNLKDNLVGADGAGRLAGVLAQSPALTHLDLSRNVIGATGAKSLAGVLRSAESWLTPTSISVAISSEQMEQGDLQGCW